MPIPGSGFNGDDYINPNANKGPQYDPTLRKANRYGSNGNDFYTKLTFPAELATMDIRSTEIRDFMEIEILKIVGQGFEEFYDNVLPDSVTVSQFTTYGKDLTNLNLNPSVGTTADNIEYFSLENIKKAASKTMNDTGLGDLVKDNTKLREQKLDKITKIWLYEPALIESSYGLRYNDEDFSAIKKAQALVTDSMDVKIPGQVIKQGLSNIVSNIIEGMSRVGKTISGRELLGGDLNVKKYIDYKSRSVPTPLLEYLFEGISRRKFQFTWKLYPKTRDDVYNVYNIIRNRKKNAHPTRLGSFYLKFPNIFKIRHLFLNNQGEISENFYVNRIKPCVLENIKVNYTDSNGYLVFDKEFDLTIIDKMTNGDDLDQSGYPNYFGKGKAPIGIQIQLDFAELELLLSEDFDITEPSDNNPFGGGGY